MITYNNKIEKYHTMKKLILLATIAILCGTNAATAQTDTVNNKTFVEVDIKPEFPGGIDSMYAFL